MYVIAQANNTAATMTVATGAATTAFVVAPGLPGAGNQLNLNAPGSNRLTGVPFIVRASGLLTLPAGTVTASATPIQFEMAASNTTSFAVATGNVIFSATAMAIFSYASAAATTVPYMLEATFAGGGGGAGLLGKSNFITVDPNGVVGGAATAVATIHSPTAINWTTEPPVQFAIAVITAASNNFPTGTTLTLSTFEIESGE